MSISSKAGLTVALTVAAVLALLPAPAMAGCCGGDTSDPADTAGKLDIAMVRWVKEGDDAPMTVTVTMHERWRLRALRARNRLVIAIDADGDRAIDYRARVRRMDGHLMVFIKGSGSSFEPLEAHRPNRRTVHFTVPGDSPPNPQGDLALFARSRYVNDGRCAGGCVDRAPDSGRI